MLTVLSPNEQLSEMRTSLLQGDRRMWWDIDEKKMVPAQTLYLAQGCPDWGETNGTRNKLCTFCAIPNAVLAYRMLCYDGKDITQQEHLRNFEKNLESAVSTDTHTLFLFNGGSFLSTAWPARSAG